MHRRHHLHAPIEQRPDVDGLSLASRRAPHLEQAAHDAVDALDLFFDAVDDLEGRRAPIGAHSQHREVPENARQRVPDLVRHAGGELADGRAAVGRDELGLQPRLLLRVHRELRQPACAGGALCHERITQLLRRLREVARQGAVDRQPAALPLEHARDPLLGVPQRPPDGEVQDQKADDDPQRDVEEPEQRDDDLDPGRALHIAGEQPNGVELGRDDRLEAEPRAPGHRQGEHHRNGKEARAHDGDCRLRTER